MPDFYRVLSPGMRDLNGMIRGNTIIRWLERKFTSTHAHTPENWIQTWHNRATLHSTNKQDYQLAFLNTVYTDAALTAFLRFAPNHNNSERWTDEEMKLTGDYSGVSAVDNPEAALAYGAGPAAVFFQIRCLSRGNIIPIT